MSNATKIGAQTKATSNLRSSI